MGAAHVGDAVLHGLLVDKTGEVDLLGYYCVGSDWWTMMVCQFAGKSGHLIFRSLSIIYLKNGGATLGQL